MRVVQLKQAALSGSRPGAPSDMRAIGHPTARWLVSGGRKHRRTGLCKGEVRADGGRRRETRGVNRFSWAISQRTTLTEARPSRQDRGPAERGKSRTPEAPVEQIEVLQPPHPGPAAPHQDRWAKQVPSNMAHQSASIATVGGGSHRAGARSGVYWISFGD